LHAPQGSKLWGVVFASGDTGETYALVVVRGSQLPVHRRGCRGWWTCNGHILLCVLL